MKQASRYLIASAIAGPVLALATAGAAVAAPAAGVGATESAPGCPGAVQIGNTAYIKIGGKKAASVKQYKGCGKNFGYAYVWESYRSNHHGWTICAAVANRDDMTLNGLRCGGGKEIWSSGTDTLDHCTRGVGAFPDVATAETDTRC